MNNESKSNLNVILGQLEDELRAIKSAREQADGVVSANSELSAKLERVVVETRDLIEKSNDQTRTAAESLAGEVDRMSEQTDAIKKAAADGSEAIAKQAADAQAMLTGTAGSVVESLSVEAKRITEHLQAIEESSSGIAVTIQTQASDAQAALGQAASDAVERASAQMSGLVEQAMSSLNGGIDKARGEMDTAAELVRAAAKDIGERSDALLEANETFASENKRQNEETRALLDGAQKHLDEIDANIATLKEIDVSTLAEEIGELKSIEADNAASLKSKLMTVTVMSSASIVLCIAILAKLLIG